MTQATTVVDNNVPLLMDDDKANPYNKKKPWHNKNATVPVQNADTLFYSESAPDKVKTKPESSDDDKAMLEKRWKDLKKHYDTTQVEWKQTVAELQSQLAELKNSAAIKAPENVEDLDKLKQEDPALYNKIEALARKIAQSETSEVKTKLDDINKREYDLAKKEARKELLKAHPDVYTLVETDDFKTWASKQPQAIKDWIYNNPTDSSLAIRAIDLFKADFATRKTAESKTNSRDNLDEDASSLVSTKVTTAPADGTKKIWTRQEIQRLSMDEYDRLEAEIDQAIREGRVK